MKVWKPALREFKASSRDRSVLWCEHLSPVGFGRLQRANMYTTAYILVYTHTPAYLPSHSHILMRNCCPHYWSHTYSISQPILWHNHETKHNNRPTTQHTHKHRQISQILTGVCVTGVRECDSVKGAWVSAVTLHPPVSASWLICQSSVLCLALRGKASPFYYWSVKKWFMLGGQDKWKKGKGWEVGRRQASAAFFGGEVVVLLVLRDVRMA